MGGVHTVFYHLDSTVANPRNCAALMLEALLKQFLRIKNPWRRLRIVNCVLLLWIIELLYIVITEVRAVPSIVDAKIVQHMVQLRVFTGN